MYIIKKGIKNLIQCGRHCLRVLGETPLADDMLAYGNVLMASAEELTNRGVTEGFENCEAITWEWAPPHQD